MKKTLLILLFIPLVSFGQSESLTDNKNNIEALSKLSYSLIEKIQNGLNNEDKDLQINKIKSINQQLINNVDSKESQYAGNFLNGTLYMSIMLIESEKLSKEGISKADVQKKMKERNEYKSSIFFFNEALKITPNDVTIINFNAMIESMVGNYENACKNWKTNKEVMENAGINSGNFFYDQTIDNINEHCNK